VHSRGMPTLFFVLLRLKVDTIASAVLTGVPFLLWIIMNHCFRQ